MRTVLPAGCGNAPRIGMVGELTTQWAGGDWASLAESLAYDVTWTQVGNRTYCGVGAAEKMCPEVTAKYLEITSIITHGRLASCDGFLDYGSARIDFSLVFTFASASKSARVKMVRSYCIDTRDTPGR